MVDVRGPSVAFRFPSEPRTITRLYRLPDLEEVAWRFESGSSETSRTVGFASDDDLVYSLTTAHQLISLDLTSGRARAADTNVALAMLGPTGIPYVVHDDGTVGAILRRSLVDWPATFTAEPEGIWGATRGRMVAVHTPEGGSRTLELLAEGRSPIHQSIPQGDLAVSHWGDAVAVATDSGVALFDPADPDDTGFVPITPAPQLVTFSASAHRIVVIDRRGLLRVIERFDGIEVDSMALPGPATAMRPDPLGRVLLVQPAGKDSLWIVDALNWRLVATIAAEWSEDLPTVARDGTLLLRRDDKVVAAPLTHLDEERSVSGTADQWLTVAWDPRRPALELAAEATKSKESTAGQLIYVQVSSTHNPDWAGDYARNLRRAGMDASVLPPEAGEELFRVVLGPFPDREEAERTAQKLGLPFWIFTADTSSVDSTGVRP